MAKTQQITPMDAEFTEGEVVPHEPKGGPLIEVITAQPVAIKRSNPAILSGLRELAAMAGENWFYRYPVRAGGGGVEHIEGPSIKCANAVARLYGNCQIDTRVVDGRDSWMIYARFVDLETGFSYTRPFQQRKDQASFGTRNQNRAQDMALQVGVSKAIRNVVTNALETFTTFAYEEARKNMVERIGTNLVEYRGRVIDRLNELKVDKARVERTLGRSAHEWLAPDIARIIAQIQAINDGMGTAEEAWPSLDKTSGSKLDQLEAVIRDRKKSEKEPDPVAGDFWARESYLIEIPSMPGGKKHDFTAYTNKLISLLNESTSTQAAEKLIEDNQRGRDTMKLVMPDLYEEVRTAYNDAIKRLDTPDD